MPRVRPMTAWSTGAAASRARRDGATHLLHRVVADSGKKAVADSSPTPGCALAEGVAQERERCGPEGIVASVLRAEHHLGLVRMQPESDLAEPGSDPLPHVPGLLLADTMRHNVVA